MTEGNHYRVISGYFLFTAIFDWGMLTIYIIDTESKFFQELIEPIDNRHPHTCDFSRELG